MYKKIKIVIALFLLTATFSVVSFSSNDALFECFESTTLEDGVSVCGRNDWNGEIKNSIKKTKYGKLLCMSKGQVYKYFNSCTCSLFSFRFVPFDNSSLCVYLGNDNTNELSLYIDTEGDKTTITANNIPITAINKSSDNMYKIDVQLRDDTLDISIYSCKKFGPLIHDRILCSQADIPYKKCLCSLINIESLSGDAYIDDIKIE